MKQSFLLMTLLFFLGLNSGCLPTDSSQTRDSQQTPVEDLNVKDDTNFFMMTEKKEKNHSVIFTNKSNYCDQVTLLQKPEIDSAKGLLKVSLRALNCKNEEVDFENARISVFEGENKIMIVDSRLKREASFENNNYKIALPIVVDLSASMLSHQREIIQSTRTFVQDIFESGTEIYVKVFWFDGRRQIRTIGDWSNQLDTILKNLADLHYAVPTHFSTNLYGALETSLYQTETALNVRFKDVQIKMGKILLFTDGSDGSAVMSRERIMRRISETSPLISIYSLAYKTDDLDEATLSKISGEKKYFVFKDALGLEEALDKVKSDILKNSGLYHHFSFCPKIRQGNNSPLYIRLSKDEFEATVKVQADMTLFEDKEICAFIQGLSDNVSLEVEGPGLKLKGY